MTIERKKKLHKILLICLVSVLTVILLANAVLLYLFVPISPKSSDSIWDRSYDFYNYIYYEQYSRQEFFSLFSSEEETLFITIKFRKDSLDTGEAPISSDFETQDEYEAANKAYQEQYKEKWAQYFKEIIKTYKLNKLPLYYKFYPDYTEIRLHVDGHVTVPIYKSCVKKLKAMHDDPAIRSIHIGNIQLGTYMTVNFLPIDTLFE